MVVTVKNKTRANRKGCQHVSSALRNLKAQVLKKEDGEDTRSQDSAKPQKVGRTRAKKIS